MTEEEVWTACDALVSSGEEVTRRAVLRAVGRGSMTTVARMVTTWEERQRVKVEARDFDLSPEESEQILMMGRQLLRSLTDRVRIEAAAREKELMEAAERERRRATSLAADYDILTAERTADLEARDADIARLNVELAQTQSDLADGMSTFKSGWESSFEYFSEEIWPAHCHFNAGVKTVFAEDPDHRKVRATEVKFLFLDKAYSAGLRRWVKRCDDADDRCRRVNGTCRCDPIDLFMRHLEVDNKSSAFRMLIERSTKIGQTLEAKNLKEVEAIHGQFKVALQGGVRKATWSQNGISRNSENETNIQSFCSKYLWFHAGVFPVYDNLARRGIARLESTRPLTNTYYYNYYARLFFSLLKSVYKKSAFEPDEIKCLDGYLTWIGGDKERLEVKP